MTTQDNVAGFVTALTNAARENPVAAALIGGGALWMMLGKNSVRNAAATFGDIAMPAAGLATRGVGHAAASAADAAGSAGRSVADSGMSAMGHVGQFAADTASTARDGASSAVEWASESIRDIPNPMPSIKKQTSAAQSALTDVFERQPLVLGAVGLIIGAGVASALARSELENEWVGSASDDVKDALTKRAADVAERAQDAVGELKSDLGAASAETVDRLKTASGDALKSIKKVGA